jgi:hypothetical protein
MLDVVPHVAETFVLAVGNSELKYSTIFMYLFIVFFCCTIEYIIK